MSTRQLVCSAVSRLRAFRDVCEFMRFHCFPHWFVEEYNNEAECGAMVNFMSWWRKIAWKKWQYLLLAITIMFTLIQLCNMSILELIFASEASNGVNNNHRHRQNIAIKKVLSKWEEPQHSKLLRDPEGHAISLRGTRDTDIIKYFPNSKGKFVCFSSKDEIDFLKVNDDYCDCPLDGSDEPGTNACNNGIFYCEKASKSSKVKIPSYQVNDGVCDCCDGSDEWQEVSVLDASDVSENRPLKYRLTYCENICTKNIH